MKKLFVIVVAMMASLTASAQFTVYKNVPDPTRSSNYNPYRGYETNPYRGYETNPYGNQYRSTPKPKAKQYTLTGYYKKSDGWYQTKIKISVSEDEVKLIGVKYGNNWAGCSSKVSEVGAFDSKEVQDNFNYKGYFTYLGTIYF